MTVAKVAVKMRKFSIANIIFILNTVNIIVKASSIHYTEYPKESDKICHPFHKKGNIKLPDTDDAAVIVKPSNMFNLWNPSANQLCKYVFKTHRDTGLFAVVQSMYFRSNGTECVDYVQFKEDGHKSKLFCGNPSIEDNTDIFNHLLRNYTKAEFRSAKGEIETLIFISKEKLMPGETLDFTIVYTPYKDCDKLKDKSKYRLNSNKTCISSSYYCDGYKNCAFDSCLDEAGCEIIVSSDGTGTKVTVGAVTTLVLSFLLFIMCLWTCRKHKKLCWSPDCAGPNIGGSNTQSIDLRPRGTSDRSVVPTAPMLDEATARPVHNKDLPPSYDSLFPDQSVPSAT